MTLNRLAADAVVPFTHSTTYGAQAPRWPMLEVEIAVTTAYGVLTGGTVRTTLLVDSGADVTMLDSGLAAPLGVDLSQCPTHFVGGIGGRVLAHRANVKMDLCGRWVDAPVDFTPNRQPQLLGREGVFDAIHIAFIHGRTTLLARAA